MINQNQSNQYQVMMTDDGHIRRPTTLSGLQIAFHLMCSMVGMPLNLLIVWLIVSLRRLHNPRQILWLGVAMSNLAAFGCVVVELVDVLQPSDAACLTYTSMVALPYASLLYNLLLALLDRYVVITNPLRYKKKVTIRRVVACQVIGVVLLSLIIKAPFLSGWIDLECEIHLIHAGMIGAILVTLFVSCLALQVIVYRQVKKVLDHHVDGEGTREMSLSAARKQRKEKTSDENAVIDDANPVTPCGSPSTLNNPLPNSNQEAFFVQVGGNQSISKLELEAARTLTTGVTSLTLFVAPMFLSVFSVAVCRWVTNNCGWLEHIAPDVRELALLHAVYNPIMYITRNKEFRSALKDKFS